MRVPASPSSAGSNVSAASIITATTIAAVKPRTATYGMPEISSPQIAMTTVVPANRTAWPAVATACPTDCFDLHARDAGSRGVG